MRHRIEASSHFQYHETDAERCSRCAHDDDAPTGAAFLWCLLAAGFVAVAVLNWGVPLIAALIQSAGQMVWGL